MSTQSRKHRGYKTQAVVAAYLAANGWPYAESTGAGRQGADVTGTPDLAIEVKARTDFNPLAWIRQAEATADGRLPMVWIRCNKQGEHPEDYPVLMRGSDMVRLLLAAGFGDPDSVPFCHVCGPELCDESRHPSMAAGEAVR